MFTTLILIIAFIKEAKIYYQLIPTNSPWWWMLRNNAFATFRTWAKLDKETGHSMLLILQQFVHSKLNFLCRQLESESLGNFIRFSYQLLTSTQLLPLEIATKQQIKIERNIFLKQIQKLYWKFRNCHAFFYTTVLVYSVCSCLLSYHVVKFC